jgi:hypothetical protein
MSEETRTFPIRLTSSYTPGSIIEFCHFRDTIASLGAGDKLLITLESVNLVLNLGSFKKGILPDYDGTESEEEKVAKFNKAEERSERLGLQFLTRKDNTGDWEEDVEQILINRGRKDYLDIQQPFFSKGAVRLVEKNESFAVRLVDYGHGLIRSTDWLRIRMGFTIVTSKKNDIEALQTRISALEALLQPFGAATPTATGTKGLVEGAALGQGEFMLRGDRTWQNPISFVRTIGQQLIEGLKTFAETIISNKDIRSQGSGLLGGLSNQSQATLFAVGGGGYLSLSSGAAPSGAKLIDFGLNADGIFTVRRLNDNYSSVVANLLQTDTTNNLRFFNFTNLGGNILIKILNVEGVTSASQDGTTNIPIPLPTGIDSSKIKGFYPTVSHNTLGKILPNFTRATGMEYQCFIDNNVIAFRLSATNSANILNKPCSCLIIYTN